MIMPWRSLGDLVHDSEKQARDYEGHMNPDHPGQLLVTKRRQTRSRLMHKRLEQINGGYGNDRANEF